MLQWIQQFTAGKPLLALIALTGLSTCAGCAGGFVETRTGPAVERLYDAADGTFEEAEATLSLYTEVGEAAEWVCFDAPVEDRAPLETCEAVGAALNASYGVVETLNLALADAEAARLIYEDYDVSKGEEGLLAAQSAAIEATGLALSVWSRTRPRILRAIETIGKFEPPVEDAPAP